MAKHRKSYRLSDEDIRNIEVLAERWTGVLADRPITPSETFVISEALRRAVSSMQTKGIGTKRIQKNPV
jgi:hypothetical protein